MKKLLGFAVCCALCVSVLNAGYENLKSVRNVDAAYPRDEAALEELGGGEPLVFRGIGKGWEIIQCDWDCLKSFYGHACVMDKSMEDFRLDMHMSMIDSGAAWHLYGVFEYEYSDMLHLFYFAEPVGGVPEHVHLVAGSSTKGSRYHYHGNAQVVQVVGEKAVFLAGPEYQDVFECDFELPEYTECQLPWRGMQSLPEGVPMQWVTLKPGDVLFIPADWVHIAVPQGKSVSWVL